MGAAPFVSPRPTMALTAPHPLEVPGEPRFPRSLQSRDSETGLPGTDSVTVAAGIAMLPLREKNNMNHFFQEKDKKTKQTNCKIHSIITRNHKMMWDV